MTRVSFLLDDAAVPQLMMFLSAIHGRYNHLHIDNTREPFVVNATRANGVDHHERAVAQLEAPPAGAIAAYADAQKAATSWARSKPKPKGKTGGARAGAGRPKGSGRATSSRADLIRLLGAKGPFTAGDLTAFGARYAIDGKSMANTLNTMRTAGKIIAEKNEEGTRNTYRLAPEPEPEPQLEPEAAP